MHYTYTGSCVVRAVVQLMRATFADSAADRLSISGCLACHNQALNDGFQATSKVLLSLLLNQSTVAVSSLNALGKNALLGHFTTEIGDLLRCVMLLVFHTHNKMFLFLFSLRCTYTQTHTSEQHIRTPTDLGEDGISLAFIHQRWAVRFIPVTVGELLAHFAKQQQQQ